MTDLLDVTDEESGMDEDVLSRLAKLAREQMDLEDRIEKKMEELKALNKSLLVVSGETIPSIMDETGLSEVRLADGTKIVVKDDIKVSTTGKYRDAINSWLEETGRDSIIRDEVKINLGAGKSDMAGAIIEAASGMGIDEIDRKRFVNAMTFASLVRELLENGESVPLEDIGAFRSRQTKLQRP